MTSKAFDGHSKVFADSAKYIAGDRPTHPLDELLVPAPKPRRNSNLTPDANGCFQVVLSHLGRADINGIIKTPLDDVLLGAIKERLKGSPLYGELGVPTRSLHESSDAFLARINDIAMVNISHRICDIKAEMVDDPEAFEGKRQTLTAIVAPCGPHGDELRAALMCEGANFGMRAYTRAIPGEKNFATPDSQPAVHEVIGIISWDIIANDPYPGV